GTLRADADTDRLALALLAALQGGLLLTQTRRTTAPLETALDTTIELIRSYAARA
ncbi:MAG: TetR/AcrR family transcriptional regulator, partial [Jatrophihabitans endophyticus]|nr:TetR/AcrR family transcriptional regulator [Jatrophihabitans endophyticus]